MRLLIIAPESYPVPSAKGTSVETCIYNIAHNMAMRHRVTVVSRMAKHLPRSSIRGGVQIIHVKGSTRRVYLTRVLQAIRGQSFDHIQVDNRPSFLASVRKYFPKTPLSIFLHSLTFVTHPKTSISKVRSQLAAVDMIVVNSKSLKNRVSQLYPTQSHKIEVVHLGVDASQFHSPNIPERAQARAEYGVEGAFAIIYAGRVTPLKGIPVLIKAAELVYQEVPSAVLLLAGSGKKSYVSYVKALARKVNVPIRFIGLVPRYKMPRVYWAADCFACPTQGHEAFGLVVVEALASGLPTVASLNGGIQEIITHKANGLLIEDYDNPSKFAEAIVSLAKNCMYAKGLGEQGHKTCVSRFTWQRTSESLQRLYFGGECRWKQRNR